MKKTLFISIIALLVSSAGTFGQDITYKQNAFGLDLGFGGTSYNDKWWGSDTGSAFTFDLGMRYLHNFSPYFGVDFFKFKPLTISYKNIGNDYYSLDYFAWNPQLMTGVRGYSPRFTRMGMCGYAAFRIGAGLLVNTATDYDRADLGIGGGVCFEFEIGMYLNRTVFVGFAYNHQGGGLTFDDEYSSNFDIKGNYPAFRIGFDLGGVTTTRRGGGAFGRGGGAGAGSGSAQASTPQPKPEPKPAVKEEPRNQCYTIGEMKEMIRNKEDIRGKKICAVKQVNFEFGKSTLTRDDKYYLDEIVNLMKQSTQIHFQINGHTDNVGTEEFNINLSRDRARAVYDYLVSQGISASRLTYEYYGTRRPIADNDTDEGRALNRRVEFEIVSQ